MHPKFVATWEGLEGHRCYCIGIVRSWFDTYQPTRHDVGKKGRSNLLAGSKGVARPPSIMDEASSLSQKFTLSAVGSTSGVRLVMGRVAKSRLPSEVRPLRANAWVKF
jgi:hypothetical protein